jgi:hypothetical protein
VALPTETLQNSSLSVHDDSLLCSEEPEKFYVDEMWTGGCKGSKLSGKGDLKTYEACEAECAKKETCQEFFVSNNAKKSCYLSDGGCKQTGAAYTGYKLGRGERPTEPPATDPPATETPATEEPEQYYVDKMWVGGCKGAKLIGKGKTVDCEMECRDRSTCQEFFVHTSNNACYLSDGGCSKANGAYNAFSLKRGDRPATEAPVETETEVPVQQYYVDKMWVGGCKGAKLISKGKNVDCEMECRDRSTCQEYFVHTSNSACYLSDGGCSKANGAYDAFSLKRGERPGTEAPVEPETEATVQPETEAPVQPETEAPVQPETEAPVQPEPETEAPAESYSVTDAWTGGCKGKSGKLRNEGIVSQDMCAEKCADWDECNLFFIMGSNGRCYLAPAAAGCQKGGGNFKAYNLVRGTSGRLLRLL